MLIFNNIEQVKAKFPKAVIYNDYIKVGEDVFAMKHDGERIYLWKTPLKEVDGHFVHKIASHIPREGKLDKFDDPLFWIKDIPAKCKSAIDKMSETTRRWFELNDELSLKILANKKIAETEVQEIVEIPLENTIRLSNVVPGQVYEFDRVRYRAFKLYGFSKIFGDLKKVLLLHESGEDAFIAGDIKLPLAEGSFTTKRYSFLPLLSEFGSPMWAVIANYNVEDPWAMIVRIDKISEYPLVTRYEGYAPYEDNIEPMIKIEIYHGVFPEDVVGTPIGGVHIKYDAEKKKAVILVPKQRNDSVTVACTLLINKPRILTLSHILGSSNKLRSQLSVWNEIMDKLREFDTGTAKVAEAAVNIDNAVYGFRGLERTYKKLAEGTEEGNPPSEVLVKNLKPGHIRIIVIRRISGKPISGLTPPEEIFPIASKLPPLLGRILTACGLGSFENTLPQLAEHIDTLHAARDELGKLLLKAIKHETNIPKEDLEKAIEAVSKVIDCIEGENEKEA